MSQQTLLCLANTPVEALPADLQGQSLLQANVSELHSLPTLVEAFFNAATPEQQPTIIVGSYQTPVLHWVSAQRAYPDVVSLCYEGETSGLWRDLNTSDAWGVVVEEAEETAEETPEDIVDETVTETLVEVVTEAPTEQPTEQVTPAPTVKTEPSTPAPKAIPEKAKAYTSMAQYEDGRILSEIFKFASYAGNENMRQVQALMDEARSRYQRNPKLAIQAEEKKRYGEASARLKAEVEKKVKAQFSAQGKADKEALLTWLKTQPDFAVKQIAGDVKFKMEKTIQHYETKQTQYQVVKGKPQTFKSKVTAPVFKKGHHPNNVRFLEPSQQWTVMIDETGSNFSSEAQELGYRNKDLGRVVALVVPQRTESKLPALAKHHATTSSDDANDKIIQTILTSDVGVFGFTMQDDGLSLKHRWFDAIAQLVRWTMLMLPLKEKTPTHIKFMIEQRSYDVNYPLDILAEGLESELKTINPERFANCHIKMDFIGKDGSPLNGYVDTVAHAWGSSAAVPSDRLKQSKLEGHCLLRPDTSAIERIYLAANAQKILTPTQWYEICESIKDEPSNSLLHNMMADIGKRVQADSKQWQSYMSIVNDKMRTKTYETKSLGIALDWLHQYLPAGEQLSGLAKLQWHSAKLAQHNHEGHVDMIMVKNALTLATQLRNESAVDACGVALRIASTVNNNFEFENTLPFMQKWLAEDIAVPGLSNHAKLHSTVGQMMAFTQNPKEAVVHFDQAINFFAQLSDQVQSKKDIAQTNTYKLIAMLDSGLDGASIAQALWTHLAISGKNKEQITRKFAVSGGDAYNHHLLLRAFVTYPEVFKAEIAVYLSEQDHWQSADTHPWQWIGAYRGWLLMMVKNKPKQAVKYFNQAINLCVDAGITVQWIGCVISVMGLKLGLGVSKENLSKTYLESLQVNLPNAPFSALQSWHEDKSSATQASILQALAVCTPFNFH